MAAATESGLVRWGDRCVLVIRLAMGKHHKQSRGLDNLIIVVVPTRKHGIGESAGNTARDHADVLIRIERTIPGRTERGRTESLEAVLLSLLARGR